MSETKFTPGPWRMGESPSSNPHRFYIKAEDAGICEGCQWLHTDPVEESKANAHLIAAAPEMYKRLEACVDLLTFIANHAELHNWYSSAMKEAAESRKVLAKARGEK